MGFDFGAFAGGLMDGADKGMRVGRNIRDIIRENRMQSTLAAAREEAAAAYDAGQNKAATSVIEAPAQEGQPYQSESGAVVTPIKPASIVENGVAPIAQEAAPAASLPPSVATQAPAAAEASADPNKVADKPFDGPTETGAKATPQQQVIAGGVPPAQAAQAAATPPVAAPVQPGKYESEGKAFDTRKQAEANAGVKNDPVSRSLYIQKHMAQKAQDYFLSIGDMDTAEKYGKYAETLAGKQAIKDWADAKSAPDIDTRAKNFGKYYTDHVNDGVDYAGHKVLTKEDGTQVAVVSLKDKRTGKTSEMELTDEKMLQLGDAWNPAAVFKSEQSKAASVAAQKAKVAEEVLKSNLRVREEGVKAGNSERLEGVKAKNAQDLEAQKGRQKLSEESLKGQIDAQNVGEKKKAELNAEVELLKDSGYTDDEIKPLVPMLLKAGFKKGTSPEERRDIWITEIIKNEPRIKEDDLNKKLEIMERARGGEKSSAPRVKPADSAKPAATGPVDATTFRHPNFPGRLFSKKDGKYVDIGPDPKYTPAQAAPKPSQPVAGGLPKTREWVGKVE